MTPPFDDSLFHPYTKKRLTLVRCVYAAAIIGLGVLSFWHLNALAYLILSGILWIVVESIYRAKRQRCEDILVLGEKITARILDKTHNVRQRLCFFLMHYEIRGGSVETTVCVPDAIYHQYQIEAQVSIVVSPDHPKQCIVLSEKNA